MRLQDLKDADLAYLEGFVTKCAAQNVDPEALLEKLALVSNVAKPTMRAAMGELGQAFKGVGRAAMGRAAPMVESATSRLRPILGSLGENINAFTGGPVSDLRGANQAIRNYLSNYASQVATDPAVAARVKAMQAAQEKVKSQLAAAKADPVYQFGKTFKVPQTVEGLRSGIRSHPIMSGLGALGAGAGLTKMLGGNSSSGMYTGPYRD